MTVQLRKSRKLSRAISTVGLLSALTLIAACGSDSTDSGDASEESTTSAESAELIKVRYVQPWVIQGESAGQFAAVEQGYFAEEGLDVEIIPGGPDVRAGALLTAGSAEFAVMNPAGVYTNRQEGIPIKAVGGINQSDGLLLVCKKETGVTGFGDLSGKKIGIWIGGGESGMQAATLKAGVALDSVEWLPQKFSMEEFFQGAFDCASATEWNEKHIVYKEGFVPGENLVELRPSDEGLFLPGDSIVASESTIAEKPEMVQGIINGTLRGWQWTCSSEENRRTGAQYTVDAAPDLDLELQVIQVDEMCNLMSLGPAAEVGLIGDMVQSSWQTAADATASIGLLEAPYDVPAGFTDQFVANVPPAYREITW